MIQPISVFNQSSLVSAAELTAMIGAINNVSMPQFAAKWNGLQAELTFDKPAGAWAYWLLDRTTIAGDLAFHLSQNNVPVIQVFAETILSIGESLCAASDHEIKEALGDPTAAATVRVPGGKIVKENCDPVSAGRIDLGGGLLGSNFVFPNWFIEGSAGPWDYLGQCTGPLKCAPGGYTEKLRDGETQWELAALRGPNGYSWRHNYPGRLAYRARNRAP